MRKLVKAKLVRFVGLIAGLPFRRQCLFPTNADCKYVSFDADGIQLDERTIITSITIVIVNDF